MDLNGKDINVGEVGSESKLVINGDSPKGVVNGERDEDDESKALLLPRRGGLSTKSVKKQRKPQKVQWNDTNGHNLTEVLEYQPSDDSDSDDDEDADACICNIIIGKRWLRAAARSKVLACWNGR